MRKLFSSCFQVVFKLFSSIIINSLLVNNGLNSTVHIINSLLVNNGLNSTVHICPLFRDRANIVKRDCVGPFQGVSAQPPCMYGLIN